MLYLSFKSEVRRIIDKHFPPELSRRFTLRTDTEIFLPKEDEGVWKKWKSGKENVHIMFDGREVFEVPHTLPQKYTELYFLRAFKWSVEGGSICIEKETEWVDKETVKRNKRDKEKKKQKKMLDAFAQAMANPMKEGEIINYMKDKTKKARKAQKLVQKEA